MIETRALQEHYRSLGLPTRDEYFKWCRENGFPTHFDKDSIALGKERAVQSLRVSVEKDLKKVFIMIKNGASVQTIGYFYFANEFKEIENSKDPFDKNFFIDLLLHLHKRSKLLDSKIYFKALAGLVEFKSAWVRDYKDWDPKSHNVHKQFSSLVRHLLANYDVPLFMDTAWVIDNQPYFSKDLERYHREWFIHIGQGQNIRNAGHLPFQLTKMMAHHFLQAPDHYNIGDAFLWCLVKAEGGDSRLADSLLGTRVRSNFGQGAETFMTLLEKHEFRVSTIRFLIKNPMLDTEQIGPILDYVYQQKYTPVRGGGPEEPNFSFTGRTVDSLMKQVERWHRQLGKEKKGGDLIWKPSFIRGLEYLEGTPGTNSFRTYTIHEILNSKELSEEGRAMHHCVASYAHSCASGKSSIWSLQLHQHDGNWRLLTIEIEQKSIRQVRGPYNRMSNQKEKDILRRWASKEGLSIASYLGE